VSIELYTSVTSLAGVVLGGGLSYVIQHATQRSAERAEARRLETARAEARRSERMAIMDRLLVNIQDAERVAAERHYGGVVGAEWQARADAVMDRVWVAEKMVHILCTPTMVEAAQ